MVVLHELVERFLLLLPASLVIASPRQSLYYLPCIEPYQFHYRQITVVVSGGGLASTEVYNATTGVWSLSGNRNVARGNNTATRFMSGLILVTGGIGSSGVLNSSEIYTP